MVDGFPSPVRVAADAQQAMAQALEGASAFVQPSTAFVSLAIGVQPGKVSNLIGLWPERPFFAYSGQLGLGVAHRFELDGFDVARAKRWATSLFTSIGGTGQPPIFCGGAFSPHSIGKGRWSRFPAFSMLLPRWHYWQEPQPSEHAQLSLTIGVSDLAKPEKREQALTELAQLLACLDERPEPAAPIVRPRRSGTSEADWSRLVGDGLTEIAAGRFQKLVLARATVLEADAPWSMRDVFDRLLAAEGTTFAVRFDEGTFLGVTPETLVGGLKTHFHTHALAGTAQPSADTASLLASKKDAHEHRVVVDDILERLRPFSIEANAEPAPTARRLKDVIHLQTRISLTIKPSAELLDLAHALHPTPAVGGLPRDSAIEWINTHEREPRGWYAGFVGCLHRAGGDFSVAIRSGLISGREAVVYAGAGIVAGSDPAAEYRETEWKQRPFLRALGVEVPS